MCKSGWSRSLAVAFLATLTTPLISSAHSETADLVDCKEQSVQQMVVQAANDWFVLNGFPSGADYPAIMRGYHNGSSPTAGALKRKFEAELQTDVTICEAEVPGVGPFMITIFVTTDQGIGGFVTSFGAGAAVATFGGFSLQ